MLSVSASFLIWTSAALVLSLIACQRYPGQYPFRLSLGVGTAVTYLAATWFVIDVGDSSIQVASATASVLLIFYCIHSGRQVVSQWGILDALIGALMFWHVAVDSYHRDFSIGLLVVAYGEWVLPYAAGRYAVMHRQSISNLSPWFVGVGIVIGLAAIFETFTRVNLWESLFHEVDDTVRRSRSVRYGWLYRAIGPTRHPIFLAVVLTTLVPWAFGLWESAKEQRLKRGIAWAGLASIVVGIVASGSRAPLLSLGAATCFAIAIKHKIARWVFGLLIVVGGIVVGTNFEAVADLLDSNMREVSRGAIVVVDGEAEVFTGSRNRIYVARIYGPLVIKGGPMGYGTSRTSNFPPEIPGLPDEASSREKLGIVDNSYILLGLRFGWVGVGLLISLIIASITIALSLRRSADTFLAPNGTVFVTALACTLVALALEMSTVFLHYDMGFWILFLIGTVAGLQAFATRSMRGLEELD